MSATRPGPDWFDVDPFRKVDRRVVVVREPSTRAVILGSTQPEAWVDRERAERAGVSVLRRRSGGGAVWVAPGDPWWFDLWIPRDDTLFEEDIGRAPVWVGEWWVSALLGLGLGSPGELMVHRGAPERTPWSRWACFAGVASGEVVWVDPDLPRGRHKVVGVSQWRGRPGSLFSCAAYRHFDPGPLSELLAVGDGSSLRAELSTSVGVDRLGPQTPSHSELSERLLASLPGGASWEIRNET